MFEMELYNHDPNSNTHKNTFMHKLDLGGEIELDCPLARRGQTLSALKSKELGYDVFLYVAAGMNTFNQITNCPICKSRLSKNTKKQFKVYATCTNRALNVDYILNRTQFLFKRKRGMYGSTSYQAFIEDYNTLLIKLNGPLLEIQTKKKNKDKVELIIVNPFPTEQQFKDKHEDYKSWKVANAI